MNGIVIVLVAAVVLVAGYLLYGRWLARTWGIDAEALTPEALQYYDDTKGAWVAEPGDFKAFVGAASDDIRGVVDFTLK